MSTLYEILGVTKDATQEEIKKAHRYLVKRLHPDVQETGNAEQFKKVQEAYDVLSDEEMRKRYDETGQYTRVKDNFYNDFLNFMSSNILQLLESKSDLEFDLFGQIHLTIDSYISNGREKIASCREKKAHLELAIEKIKRVDEGENLLRQIVQQRIDHLDKGFNQMTNEINLLTRFKSELEKYHYDFIPKESVSQSFTTYRRQVSSILDDEAMDKLRESMQEYFNQQDEK